MEKIWLKHYPAGVPAEIDVNEFRSIGDLFDKSVKLYGPRTAYINMDKSITYAELDRLSANFGAYCQSVLKLPKGTRIALMMPNLLQYPICLYGALRAGYTVVNCNPLYTERELEHQIKGTGKERYLDSIRNVIANCTFTYSDIEGGEGGGPDEWVWTAGLQYRIEDGVVLNLDNGAGLMSKANDWALQIGVQLTFSP